MKIIKNICAFLVVSLVVTASVNAQINSKVSISLNEKGASIFPSMYGAFFEEINNAGDGGLYAELVRNRSFEDLEMPEGYHAKGDTLYPKPVFNHVFQKVNTSTFKWTTEPVPSWALSTDNAKIAKMKLTKYNPKFTSAPNNLEVSIFDDSKPVKLTNKGFWGMGVEKNKNYYLRVILRKSTNYKGKVVAKIISEKGDVLASMPIKLTKGDQWNDFKAVLNANATDPKAKLVLEFDKKGKIWLDYVSLFPEETFNNRKNGLRKDVAQVLADLKPAFFRWPGGCVVEGISLSNRFDWKKSLGDPASRPSEYSLWGYHCSYGFGYYEMLQYCEDIGAEAMFVANVGLACHYRMGDACSVEEVDDYIEDCLNAIEYAIGDVDTKWGARRVSDGHPKPFPLKYVEAGNENFGDTYDYRYNLFYKAIKEKYPQISVIYNEMPQRKGAAKIEKTDLIDPHWYEAPEFFFRNSHLFDNYERGKHNIYIGEYACNKGVGGGNMRGALSEAAFIGGMERNGDLVTMTSYAPLFENVNNRNWKTNLIWINSDQVMGRSSYYVQKMASQNRPTYNLKNQITVAESEQPKFNSGCIGLGSWRTGVEYKDIKITENGLTKNIDANKFKSLKGSWQMDNNKLNQTSSEAGTKALFKDFVGKSYVFECKAKKINGDEGFLLYWGMSQDGQNGYMYNIGGWANSTLALQEIVGSTQGQTTGKISFSVEKDKWVDLKLIVSPTKSELYLDGKLVLSNTPQSTPLRFVDTGYDETTKEMVIKTVNASSEAYPLSFQIDGCSVVSEKGRVTSLSAKSPEDENSMDNPQKIFPVETEHSGFGKNFSYEFLPYSYTIFRIKME